jgi:hypothetical protein
VTAGSEHPLRVETAPDGTPGPYLTVRPGLAARLARAVFYDVVEWGEEVAGDARTRLGVWSDGLFFDLGDLGDPDAD